MAKRDDVTRLELCTDSPQDSPIGTAENQPALERPLR